ncbi:MAG: hypothetical protein M0Z91_09915 [Actinomycetota bacterium]|nr:hypothetical protein [Actinomycetota bacterium]
MTDSESARARIAEIREELAHIAMALPGSVTVRTYACGKAYCACHKDPPKLHGPYYSWTRKVDNKTVTKLLSPESYEKLKPLLENHRRMRELVSEMAEATIAVLRDEGELPA